MVTSHDETIIPVCAFVHVVGSLRSRKEIMRVQIMQMHKITLTTTCNKMT